MIIRTINSMRSILVEIINDQIKFIQISNHNVMRFKLRFFIYSIIIVHGCLLKAYPSVASIKLVLPNLKLENLVIDKVVGSKIVFHFTATNMDNQPMDMRNIQLYTKFGLRPELIGPLETYTVEYRQIYKAPFRYYNYDNRNTPRTLAPGQSVELKLKVDCGLVLSRSELNGRCYIIQIGVEDPDPTHSPVFRNMVNITSTSFSNCED